MKQALYIFICILAFLVSCKKKKSADNVNPEPIPQVIISDDRPACEKLPEPPKPLGWRDSIYDQNTNVNAFVSNPLNGDEILCVVNGDEFGSNKLLNKNVVSKASKQLAILGNYLPQVNKNGWITFNDVNNNVFIIKANGDSLKQLTFDKVSVDPKWDYSGRFIYYFMEGIGNLPPQINKINLKGELAEIHYGEYACNAPFRNSNKLVFLKSSGSSSFCSLILKNMDSTFVTENKLFNGPLFDSKGKMYFEDLTLDQKDENLYWSNSDGIFKCNLKSLKTDTLFKNCENSIYRNIMASAGQNEMTYTIEYIKPVNSYILVHDYLPMEYNILDKSSRLVRIFPR
ncbi:MAG: hypothetical protein JNL60_09495 [Bacteroidia bacterium]|nr:hypothetical protein [Bacteroidia bacterium]